MCSFSDYFGRWVPSLPWFKKMSTDLKKEEESTNQNRRKYILFVGKSNQIFNSALYLICLFLDNIDFRILRELNF